MTPASIASSSGRDRGLTAGTLRQLMRQVGLPADAAKADRMLRQIDLLGAGGRSSSGGSSVIKMKDECSSTDGYDTACDELSEPQQGCNRNNNGTKSLQTRRARRRQLRQRRQLESRPAQVPIGPSEATSDEPKQPRNCGAADACAKIESPAVALNGLESQMNGVVLSAIEGLQSAYESLLKLQGADDASSSLQDQVSAATLNESVNCFLRAADNSSTSNSAMMDQQEKSHSNINSLSRHSTSDDPSSCESELLLTEAELVTLEKLQQEDSAVEPQQFVEVQQKEDSLSTRRPIKLEAAPQAPPMEQAAPPADARALAKRLENVEVLLVALQLQSADQHQRLPEQKQSALANLRSALTSLEATLVKLQASDLSRGLRRQHRRLDKTWNLRRNWWRLPLAPSSRQRIDELLACAATESQPGGGGGGRGLGKDRWLLKYLPKSQRAALPQLMRAVDSADLLPPDGCAAARRLAFTRARGRPLAACRHMRDPHDDVIRRFVHALR